MKLDFAELKKRLQVRAVLAVTLESGRVAVDLVRRDEGGSRVVKSFALPLGADAVLADPEKAGQEMAAQLAGAGIRERRCVVCIPAGWALTTSTDVPGVSEEDLRGYLELRAEREFPIAVADLRLAHCAYVLPDGKQRATLAAIPAKRMEAVERMLAAAECRAVSISLGLDGCVPEDEAAAALHFLANGNHVDVVVAGGGGIIALRSLAASVGPGAAAFDAAGFSREVRITLGGLPDALRQQIREARFGGSPASAENLCLEIRQHLYRMGIESRLLRPAGDPAGAPAGLAAAEHHLRKQPLVFEFLPPQVNRWQATFQRFDSRRRRWLVIAAVALLVLPILTFFVRSRIEKSLDAEWNGMRRNVADLESIQQRIRQFRPWFEPAPQCLQIIEGIANAYPEQGDVWAKSIQLGEAHKVTCAGFARSQAALLGLLDRLRSRPDVSGLQVQQVRGDNPITFSITYKWEPRDAK
ncbi:MAG: hypothetical protein QOE70_5044 [Chthoniobacter sp.]|jgi:hypothetical protein|nr:hypothetical protein [Chthoniobacter sp.]